jgi:phosphohistidine phosphatase
MLLLLLRHGDAAEIAPGGPHRDEERPLTGPGVAKLKEACACTARLIGRIDRIVASPLLRARQSAEILATAVRFEGQIERNASLVPGARPTDMLDELADAAGTVALVGHEPHLGSLLGLLLTGSPDAAIPLKKGMLVGVDVERGGLGRLQFALSQRAARELG